MTDSELACALDGTRGHVRRLSKVGVAIATSTTEVASCSPTSTACSPHFTCWWTISCLRVGVQAGAQGSPIAELVTLAVAQILLDCHSERRFLRLAHQRLGHLFPYIPKQPGYNKRMRALAPRICLVINHLARVSPSFSDRLRLLDSTPVPCGTVARDGQALGARGLGRLRVLRQPQPLLLGAATYLLCAPDGMPVYFALAPANEGEREVAAAMLERARKQGLLQGGEIIAADKGFAGQEFEEIVASLDATLIRPDRKDEKPRFGKLGGMRQWIESVYDTAKGQLSLEDHGGHIPEGVWARVCQRVLDPMERRLSGV